MAYKRKTYRYKNAVEIEEYHTGRYGAPGQERKGKSKPTPEQMEKVNQRNKEKTCRRKLRKWFREEDPYLTLTYARQERPPDMKMAKKQFEKFVDCVRKEYRKRGAVLRWIRNIEGGDKKRLAYPHGNKPDTGYGSDHRQGVGSWTGRADPLQ